MDRPVEVIMEAHKTFEQDKTRSILIETDDFGNLSWRYHTNNLIDNGKHYAFMLMDGTGRWVLEEVLYAVGKQVNLITTNIHRQRAA